MLASVVSVSRSATHSFSKAVEQEIEIAAGFGVEGDAHAGATVRHRYHVRRDPRAVNLSQVHLLHQELFAELAELGMKLAPGEMGENVTTAGVALLGLPLGTRLHLGDRAVVEVTGLRQPCTQMNRLCPGLMQACLARDAWGRVVRKAGIMAIAVSSGTVRAGDAIRVVLPAGMLRPPAPL